MVSRVIVILVWACGLAACSRPSPQDNPATSQPPLAANQPTPPPATSQPEAIQPAAEPQPSATPAAAPPPSTSAPSTPAASPSATASSSAAAAATKRAPLAAKPGAPSDAVPRFRAITIPAETPLSIVLETSLASDTNRVEDPVEGRLANAVVVSRTRVLPAGARVMGSVLDATRSGRVKGRASLAIRFHRVVVHGEPYQMQTSRITRIAGASTSSDVKKGGIGAGVGAVVGGIAGGAKGAVVGGVLGGTGTVLATRGKEVQLPAGTTLSTRLTSPLEVQVPASEGKEPEN
jgi:hypothetical protein